MTKEIDYSNNPLHGLSLKQLTTELVEHYGFTILYAYLNINCFKSNPSIDSSVKFLKKTDWAREKVEAFYMYQFKSLPRASAEQFELPPRDRIVPAGDKPGEPAELSLEDAERLREKRALKTASHQPTRSHGGNARTGSNARSGSSQRSEPRRAASEVPTNAEGKVDPWAKWRK